MTAASTIKTLDTLAELAEPGQDTTYATHGLHPYPAKFIPQIPASIIRQHTNERHVIFDPFCGSGTTLLEALLAGRRSIGCDSNPIGALISRAKTTPIRASGMLEANHLITTISAARPTAISDSSIPNDPRLSHWFTDQVALELGYLRLKLGEINDPALRQLAQCVFSSIIVLVSNQESDTRYASVRRTVVVGEVLSKFLNKLRRALISIEAVNIACKHDYLVPQIHCSDIRTLSDRHMPENCADLVVTSPPYANSFDYYLYHKWRMIWLGLDPVGARQVEIGSRYEHSSQKAPLHVFEAKMAQALEQVGRVLKPSKLAYFLVGDSVIAGELIDAEHSLRRSAHDSGLRFMSAIAYPLSKVSRSFREKASDGCHGGSKNNSKQQRVLVFESVSSGPKSPARAAISSRAKPQHQEVTLKGIVTPGSCLALKSDEVDRHVHSLARYPSKFVPLIPRWAIETFSKPGDKIADPFAGSGTTSVEALLQGRHAFAADVSPFACLATRAKTTRVSPEIVRGAASAILAWLDQEKIVIKTGARFDLDEFWFNLQHLDEFETIRQYICKYIPAEVKDFFLLCLASTVRKFGYQDEAQIKVKRDQKKVASGTPRPIDVFRRQLPKQVDRLCTFMQLASPGLASEVVQQSADIPWARLEEVDLLITSPPYINAMNYPMTHRYENLLLGYVDADEKHDHEREYIGTERVRASEYRMLRTVGSDWSCAPALDEMLAQVYAGEPKRSFICYQFFTAMRAAMSGWARLLKPGARIVLVCGTNRIRGVSIDTVGILKSFLADAGLDEITSFKYEIVKQSLRITRHATSDLINYDGVIVMEKPNA